MITFDSIPNTLRVPFVAAEFDASQAQQGPALLAYRGLMIGQKLSTGTAAANSLSRATSAEQVIALAGRGSMLHRQALAWFASNRSTELWIGALADDGAAVAASGTIVVSGTATASGTIVLYLGGERVTVGVASGTAAAAIAAAINAAINAKLDLPVTSTVSTSTVTVLQRNKGAAGNTYDMRHSHRDGEALPAGITLAITAMASGATNPVLDDLIAAMGDIWFQVWTHPYTDATSLLAIEAELADRFGPMRLIDGIAITSASGSFSTLTTLGTGRNSRHSVIVAQPGASPLTPPMEFAAEAAALVAYYGAAAPARPFTTLAMSRALPTREDDRWSFDERNLLLYAGIATTAALVETVQLERIITTYRIGPSGAEDTSYLDVNTLLTLLYLRYSWRARIRNRYSRHSLGNDNTQFGSGQFVMTPRLGKAEALAWFSEMQGLALVEGLDQFKRDLVVERSTVDPNRLDLLLPPDLINQLLVTATKFQFRL